MAVLFNTRATSLNGHSITRILPRAHRRMLGPFIFIDLMGPLEFAAGTGLDVPPHPHIGLSTLTYLFEGALVHRDSLGNTAEIRPGDVNWMTAGKGIVHSERQDSALKQAAHRLFGMQCWVALPREKGEIAPDFSQIKQADLPHLSLPGISLQLVAGSAYGMQSSVSVFSPMFFIDVSAEPGASLNPPGSEQHGQQREEQQEEQQKEQQEAKNKEQKKEQKKQQQECMLYLLEGTVTIDGDDFHAGQVAILDADDVIRSHTRSRYLLLGGPRWPQQPLIDWNFVSFSADRIAQARSDWRQQLFPRIPGDDREFVALPGDAGTGRQS